MAMFKTMLVLTTCLCDQVLCTGTDKEDMILDLEVNEEFTTDLVVVVSPQCLESPRSWVASLLHLVGLGSWPISEKLGAILQNYHRYFCVLKFELAKNQSFRTKQILKSSR